MSAPPISSRPTAVTFFSPEFLAEESFLFPGDLEGIGEQPHHDHCPLCVDSMVHPQQDEREPVIVFLDMDGVMMTGNRWDSPLSDKIRSTISRLFPDIKKCTDYHWTVAKGCHLDPAALQNLHSLIERIETSGRRALVVLSSAWRNDATLKQLREEAFAQHLFGHHLCGKTAPEESEKRWTPEWKQGFRFTPGAKKSFELPLRNRGDVIEFWLRDHGFDLISTNYVVLDDVSGSFERFGERFIKMNRRLGFCEERLETAAGVLKV